MNIKNIQKDIKSYINITSNPNLFYIIILSILFIVISYIVFSKLIIPRFISNNPLNKEIKITDDSNNKISIILFKTEWCPYCKNAKKEWIKFENYIKNINNSREDNEKILSSIIDCDKNQELADKYNIQGYPTVKMIHKNKIYDFDAKVNNDNLTEFLNTKL